MLQINLEVNQFQWLLSEMHFGGLETGASSGPNGAPQQLPSCDFTVSGTSGPYNF